MKKICSVEEFLELMINGNLDDYYGRKENKEEINYNQDETVNRYIEALKRKYDNRKKNLNSDYMYMYELYLYLVKISDLAEKQRLKNEYIEDIIEALDNNIEISEDSDLIYSYNINTDNLEDIKNSLENVNDSIRSDDFSTAFLDIEGIIEQYFKSKDLIYKNNRNSKFIKRKSREKEYLELLNSYEYKTRKITKRDIAKKLGVSPAAVTQFCKRHGIK